MVLLISITVVACLEDNSTDPNDGDDNYETVTIGNQVWMKKNLDVTKYRNGDAILHATTRDEWRNASNDSIGAWCYYDNNEGNGDTYGILYNWYAVSDERGLAPAGWKVASDNDWKILEMELGMTQAEADNSNWRGTTEGAELAGGYDLWNNGVLSNDTEFNRSGFLAYPGGERSSSGFFDDLSFYGNWWTSTKTTSIAIRRVLGYHKTAIGVYGGSLGEGYSVRCVKE